MCPPRCSSGHRRSIGRLRIEPRPARCRFRSNHSRPRLAVGLQHRRPSGSRRPGASSWSGELSVDSSLWSSLSASTSCQPELLADFFGHVDEAPLDDERPLGRFDDASGEMRMLKDAHKLLSVLPACRIARCGEVVRAHGNQTARAKSSVRCAASSMQRLTGRLSDSRRRCGMRFGSRSGGTAIDKACRTSRP